MPNINGYEDTTLVTIDEEHAAYFTHPNSGRYTVQGELQWTASSLYELINEYNFEEKDKEELIEGLFKRKSELEYLINRLSRTGEEIPRLDFFHVTTALRNN